MKINSKSVRIVLLGPEFSVKSVNHHSVIRVSRRITKRIHILVRGKGTHSNQAPRRRQISTTSTSLSLGYAERRMFESWTETSETSKHRILMNLNTFRNFMSAILDPLYGILKIQFKIRNRRRQKPLSTKFHENRSVPKILCLPYWVRYFEFRNSHVKFVISDLKNLGVQSSTKIVGFPKYYVRHIGSAILDSEYPMSNS